MRLRRQLLGSGYVLTVTANTHDRLVWKACDGGASKGLRHRLRKARVDHDRNKAVITLGQYDIEELLSLFIGEEVT